MWPFSRSETPPGPSEPVVDELLGSVQRGVLAAIGSLQQQLHALAAQIKIIDENATAARSIETRLNRVDALAVSTRGLVEQELDRLDQAINTVRGQATGMSRGGKKSRQAELGAALMESLGPERAEQLVNELQSRQGNGQGELELRNGDDVFA